MSRLESDEQPAGADAQPLPSPNAPPPAAGASAPDADVAGELEGDAAPGASPPVDVEATADAAEDAEPEIEPARELPERHLRGLLEALVFASDKPLKTGELARLASAPVKQVRSVLADLAAAYAQRGMVLAEVAGGWVFRTHVQYAPFVRELTAARPVRLTRAQLESLAIVAYRQPITRPEIDDIRGVDSGATLKLLLERDLVRILGKKDEPGRPMLYGTTPVFLELFGLKSLRDLPTLREFTELNEDSRRVAEAELGESFAADAPSTATPTAPSPPPAEPEEAQPGDSTEVDPPPGGEPDTQGP